MTSVPPIVWADTGLILPQETAILEGVLTDYDAAFGGGMNAELTTPQGQIAQSTTAIIGDTNNTFAKYVNQIDPNTSDGFMQDAIARIYFLDRKPAQSSSALCTCIGISGTVIPVGAQAIDTNGNIWLSDSAATIGIGGSAVVQFSCTQTGPIAAEAGSINQVYQSIIGWDTINNPADAVLGTNVESQAEFEFRRKQSVALNAKGSAPSIYANVFAVDNVTDCYVIDNTSDNPVAFGSTNYVLKPHSVYVAAVGGLAQDIAQAIWVKKDLGCDMNGNTSMQVLDTTYTFPQPTYTITFNIPGATPILFNVQIVNTPTLPSDIVAQVKASIIRSFTGADGGSRARIAGQLLASRFYGGISAISPNVSVLSVLLGITAPTLNSIIMGIDQSPTISESDINVTLV